MKTTDRILLLLATAGMVALFAMVFLVIPEEKTQGFVQKIFYVHVPAAWVSFLAFAVTGYQGLRYLMTRNFRHDRIAVASAEIGLVFVTLVIITGPIWARPVWGIWWTWDPRLTTATTVSLSSVPASWIRATILQSPASLPTHLSTPWHLPATTSGDIVLPMVTPGSRSWHGK